jgi:hypothetical protein
MTENKEKLIVRLDGIQHGRLSAPPIPFSFERNVLSGGAYELISSRALHALFIKDMFPEPKGKSLFSWEDLTPHLAITIAATYHNLNVNLNSNAIKKGVPFKPINDEEISNKLSKTGVMTPNEVAVKYSPGRIKLV